MRFIRRLLFGFVLCAGLSGCAAERDRDISDVAAWGLGWQLKGVHNRVQPAIPPVVRFLGRGNAGIRSATGYEVLAAEIRRAMMGYKAEPARRLQRRLIGVFLVTGLPCGARAYPVSDRGETVAAFLVLDVAAVAGAPTQWPLCGRRIAATDRPVALRQLIVAVFSEAAGAERRRRDTRADGRFPG